MFLRSKIRRKDGKDHRAWSVVENRRVHDGRVVQRQVFYHGEINDSQRAAWSKAIEVFDEGAGQSKQLALFPEDRLAPVLDCDVVSIRLNAMRLRRPRQWAPVGWPLFCGISCGWTSSGWRPCRLRAKEQDG
jgi:hypothetical protein